MLSSGVVRVCFSGAIESPAVVTMEMMSWLSASWPVDAVTPRYRRLYHSLLMGILYDVTQSLNSPVPRASRRTVNTSFCLVGNGHASASQRHTCRGTCAPEQLDTALRCAANARSE